MLLVESEPDPASRGIAQALDRLADWQDTGARVEGQAVLAAPGSGAIRLRTSRLHLHAEPLEPELAAAGMKPDLVVFLSKHAAQSGRPSLTVHPVGNFGDARYGGFPGRLTPALGRWQSHALRALADARRARDYPAEVTFEVTHHGPLLSRAALFIELGSGPAQWTDPMGAEVLARAAWELACASPPDHPIVVGLGGGHYAPRFTEAVLTRDVDVAHMVPAHACEAVADPGPLAQEVARASPGAAGVYVHRGTLDRRVEASWLEAFEAAGLPRVESRAWSPRSRFSRGHHNGFKG